MNFQGLGLLVPEWVLPWIVLAAAVAYLVGALRLSLALGLIPVVKLILAPVLAPYFWQLPVWLLPAVVLLLFLLVLQGIVSLVFGRETAGQFVGAILMRCCEWPIVALLRTIRGVGPGFYRRFTEYPWRGNRGG